MKTYLITGAAGFIGSRFVQACKKSNIQILSVDHISHFQNRWKNTNFSIEDFGTLIERENLWTWIDQQKNLSLDGIIHLGAITDTRESNLERLNHLNLEYSKKIWNFASQKKIPLIYASSAATYGDGSFGYQDDEDLMPKLKPMNAYGDSKLQFDLWALDQEKKGNHPPSWAGFKFFNVYGPGENHKEFMSSVVLHSYLQIQKTGQAVLFKSHREVIADGQQKRDFIFVHDVIDVLMFAITKPITRGIFNLGTGQARSFLDLTCAVFKALNKPENIQFIDTPLSIREKYQYFTEAKMNSLRSQGYLKHFTSLENGIHQYVQALMSNNLK